MRRITALLATTLLAAGSTAAFAGPPGAPGAPPPISPPRLALLGQAPAVQPVEFEVVLPLRNPSGLDALLAAQQDPASVQYHRWLTPAEFAERFGPGTAALNSVAATLRLFGMQVTVQSRSLHVLGSAAQANLAFNLNLSMAANTRGQHRLVTTRPITLPATLSGAGALVPAFNPGAFEAAPMIHRAAGGYIHRAAGGYGQGGAGAGMQGYFYNDLKQAYGYPSYQATIGQGRTQRLDGTGANVAVIMASDVLDSDVTAVFDAMQFKSNAGQSADPALAGRRSVNGGAAFSAANPASEEATLDVEQVLGGAPGAGVFLYDTPDLSDQSLISAYTAIVNDNLADVVSLSLGQCELYYTAQYNNGVDQTSVLHLFSELFKQGNAQGITFVAASGDAGGLGCVAPGYFAGSNGQFTAGVSVPAADPNVTAVGGTNLVTAAAAGGQGSGYARENAWSDPEAAFDPFGLGDEVQDGVWGSGGGVSTLYARPTYQSLVGTGSSSFRAVPDVAMQMGGCPDVAQAPCNGGGSILDGSGNTERSSLNIVFNGQPDAVVGTSAAAPEMASAVALLVESQGRQGNLNPYLYTLAQQQAAGGATIFHQGLGGYNGVAGNAGTYNFTTGNGTPDVASMIGLAGLPRAGAPQSASNP